MTKRTLFIRFAVILSLMFFGGIIDSDVWEMAGAALIFFWLGRWLITRYARPVNHRVYSLFLVAICFLIPLSDLSDLFEHLLGFSVLLFMGYIVINHIGKSGKQSAKRPQTRSIADLQEQVKRLDQKLQDLQQVTDPLAYKDRANHLLKALENLKQELHHQVKAIDKSTYERLMARIEREKRQLTQNLTKQGSTTPTDSLAQVADLAPEIRETVAHVHQSSQSIQAQITTAKSGNQAELLQLHQTAMRHFNSILEGYLKLKATPNAYYDVDKRLTAAKAAMEQFEQELTDQVRQLNENDMHDFEVTLRLLNQNHARRN